MAVSLVTTEALERHAWGIVQYVRAVMEAADVDQLLSDWLDEAKDALAEDLETVWEKKVIVASRTATATELQDVPYDYSPGMYRAGNLPKWTLRKRPVFSVEKVEFRLGPSLGILDCPTEWFRTDLKRGTLALVPIGHTAAIAGIQGAWFLPWFDGMQPARDIPQFAAIDYTAGWYDPAGTTLPDGSSRIQRGIYAQAVLFMLRDVGPRLVPSAVSADWSQQFTDVPTEIKLREDEVDGFKAWWSRHYRPPRMVML